MKHDLDTALDQCLSWLREGMDTKDCLDRYPEHAAELRPLLEVAANVALVQVPAPQYSIRAQGQRQMLSALTRKQEGLARTHPAVRFVRRLFWSVVPGRPGSLRPAWQWAAVMMLMIVMVSSGWLTIAATANSLPGDLLYPVKMVSQRVQLELTLDPVRHRIVADQFETEQRDDILAVLQEQRQIDVEFQGELQQIEDDLWVVGGLPVELSETTIITGRPVLGAKVYVRAHLPGNGQLVGTRLTVEPTEEPEPTDASPTATKSVETPDPTSTPSPEETVQTDDTPQPDETTEPEDTPEDKDTPQAEDTHEADSIGVETPESEGTPGGDTAGETPEAVATPEVGDTPQPNNDDIPEPDDTPKPEDTPEGDDASDETTRPEDTPDSDSGGDSSESVDTPKDDDTARSGETSEPRDTPEGDDTGGDRQKPEETPRDDDTPEPDETPEPGATPEGDNTSESEDNDTPEPDESPEPGATPEDDDTPEDNDTPESEDNDTPEPDETSKDAGEEDEKTPDPSEEPDD